MSDQSETKAAERRLIAFEEELAARALAEDMMIHDVRNPLSSIISIADMLSARATNEDDKLWLTRILTLGHRALDILKATAGYARMERGEYEPEVSRFDLLACLAAVLDKLSQLRESRSITVTCLHEGRPIAEDTCWVAGDRFFLEQLFHNLITNALEASPPQGRVRIDVQPGQPLRVVIRNQGVIRAALRDKIFDKLSSYQSSRGGGLGAYIAKVVAEQHGGSVCFTTAEREGTTFTVQLPIAVASQPV
jgi:signal transduction histidine kinase